MRRCRLVGLLICLGLAGCANRNVPISDRIQEIEAKVKKIKVQVEAIRDLGASGRLVFIWGAGHASGLSYNLTGSSGFAEILLNPPEKE